MFTLFLGQSILVQFTFRQNNPVNPWRPTHIATFESFCFISKENAESDYVKSFCFSPERSKVKFRVSKYILRKNVTIHYAE